MPTKKKAVKAVPKIDVVTWEPQPLEDWASQQIGVLKVYRSEARSSGVRAALDDLLARLRVLISECGVK